MADTDPPPPSPSSNPAPGTQVIPFPAQPRSSAAMLDMIEALTLAALGAADPGNEIHVEPQPDWSDIRKDLERQDLDAGIARAERELARGEDGATEILRSLRTRRAMRSFERGDRPAAYAEWEALITEDPSDIRPLLTRAVFFGADGEDDDTALVDYGRAAERMPNEPEVYLRRGRYFAARRDWERARADFERLVHLRPRDVEALDRLASAARFTGDHDAAIRILGRAIKLTPWRAELYASRAACFSAKGSIVEQVADLDQCIARDPKNAAALRSRAFAHSRLKDEEREVADLDRAIEIDPTHAGTFQTRAYRHQRHGRLDRALADLTCAVEIDGDSIVFRTSRAEVALATGALDIALVDLDRVIELQEAGGRVLRGRRYLRSREAFDDDGDDGAEPYWLRGHVHRRRGDRDRALGDYRRALDLDRGMLDDLLEDEQRYRTLKRTAEHLDVLDALVMLEPDEAEWRFARAEILTEAGELQKALEDLDVGIANEMPQAEAFHKRARVLSQLDEDAKAVEDASRAIALAPHVAEYHARRGIYRCFAEGPSDEAEGDVLRAVEMRPDDAAGSLFFQGWYLELADRWEEALRVQDRRVELEPDWGVLYFSRGEVRLHIARDETTLRAALADFDAAIARGYETPAVVEKRAEVRSLLGTADG